LVSEYITQDLEKVCIIFLNFTYHRFGLSYTWSVAILNLVKGPADGFDHLKKQNAYEFYIKMFLPHREHMVLRLERSFVEYCVGK
jgi:hypothetical protein